MPTLLQKCEVHENSGPKDGKIKHKAATDYLFKPCLNLPPLVTHPNTTHGNNSSLKSHHLHNSHQWG